MNEIYMNLLYYERDNFSYFFHERNNDERNIQWMKYTWSYYHELITHELIIYHNIHSYIMQKQGCMGMTHEKVLTQHENVLT